MKQPQRPKCRYRNAKATTRNKMNTKSWRPLKMQNSLQRDTTKRHRYDHKEMQNVYKDVQKQKKHIPIQKGQHRKENKCVQTQNDLKRCNKVIQHNLKEQKLSNNTKTEVHNNNEETQKYHKATRKCLWILYLRFLSYYKSALFPLYIAMCCTANDQGTSIYPMP